MKECIKCGTLKPLSSFYKRASSKDGHRNDCVECFAERSREGHLKKQYGISHDEYLDLLEEQGGCCYICDKPATEERNGVLRVDHNHDTGEVRKLLCDNCNRMLGFAGDSPEVLARALRYLLEQGHYGT